MPCGEYGDNIVCICLMML